MYYGYRTKERERTSGDWKRSFSLDNLFQICCAQVSNVLPLVHHSSGCYIILVSYCQQIWIILQWWLLSNYVIILCLFSLVCDQQNFLLLFWQLETNTSGSCWFLSFILRKTLQDLGWTNSNKGLANTPSYNSS